MDTRNITNILIIIFLLIVQISLAQPVPDNFDEEKEISGFAIGPTNIELSGSPGQRISGSFTIISQNQVRPSKYEVRKYDLGQTEYGARKQVNVGEGSRSAVEMIEIPSEITVQPGGKEKITFYVSLPQDAFGEYYAFFIIKAITEKPTAQIGASVIPAGAISLTVSSRTRSTLRVQADPLIIKNDSKSGPSLNLPVKNIGQLKVTVEGDILLYPSSGGFPIRVPIAYSQNEKPIEIYPDLKVNLIGELDHLPPPGKYRVTSRLLLNSQFESISNSEITIPATVGNEVLTSNLISKSEFDLDVEISPELFELQLTPGAKRTVTIMIRNKDDRTISVNASVRSVNMEKNGMLTFPATTSEPNSFFSLSNNEFTVDPKRSFPLRVSVDVPREDIDFTSFVKAVHLNISGPSKDTDWKNEGEFGILFLANNPQQPPPELIIDQFELVYPPGADKNPSTVLVNLANTGGKAARLHGKIEIARASGQSIAIYSIGQSKAEIILPNCKRDFRMAIPPLDMGKFVVNVEFSSTGKKPVTVEDSQIFITYNPIPEGLK